MFVFVSQFSLEAFVRRAFLSFVIAYFRLYKRLFSLLLVLRIIKRFLVYWAVSRDKKVVVMILGRLRYPIVFLRCRSFVYVFAVRLFILYTRTRSERVEKFIFYFFFVYFLQALDGQLDTADQMRVRHQRRGVRFEF